MAVRTFSEAVERWQDGRWIKQMQLNEEDVDITADFVIGDVTRELCMDPTWIAHTFTQSPSPKAPVQCTHIRNNASGRFKTEWPEWRTQGRLKTLGNVTTWLKAGSHRVDDVSDVV